MSDEKQQKSALESYAMVVCIITVVLFSITALIAIDGALNYLLPEQLMPAKTYSSFLSNEEFCRSHLSSCLEGNYSSPRLPEDVISAKREASRKVEIAEFKHNGIVDLVRNVIASGFFGALWLLHWRLGLRARKMREALDASR